MAIGRFNLSLTGVQPGGLVYVGGTTFSAASTVSLDNVFSSTYTNYKVTINCANSSNVATNFRFRVNGSDDSGANNYRASRMIVSDTSAFTRVNSDLFTLMDFGDSSHGINMEIFRPNEAVLTSVLSFAAATHEASRFLTFGARTVPSTAYTGFSIFPASGTITGVVRVYGYRNDNN